MLHMWEQQVDATVLKLCCDAHTNLPQGVVNRKNDMDTYLPHELVDLWDELVHFAELRRNFPLHDVLNVDSVQHM
jgi:hypothetical protein